MSPTVRRARIVDDLHTMGWLAELVDWTWPAWSSSWRPARPFDRERVA